MRDGRAPPRWWRSSRGSDCAANSGIRRPTRSGEPLGAPMRTLSKSDFKVARTCDTKLYYKELGYPNARDESDLLQLLADGGYMVEKLAKLLFPDGIEMSYDGGSEAAARETMRQLERAEVTLFEATLLSGTLL